MRSRLFVILTLLIGLLLVAGLTAQDDTRPFLGITFDPADSGVVVTSIVPDSAAATAGLENGDIITAINGEAVSADDLAAAIGELSAGDNVTLDVVRGDETLTLDALLQARPDVERRFQVNPFERMERAFLGVSLNVTDDGVTIAEVTPDSPAAEADLQVDDIITAINGEAIEDAAGAAELIGEMEPGDTVTLDITRAGEAMTVEATLGSWFQSNFEMAIPGDAVIFDGENWRILGLSEDSTLAAAGLQSGDTITAINGESVDPAALADLLAETDGDVTLTVEREGETLDISVAAADLEAFNTFRFFGGRGMPMPFGEGEMPFNFGFAPGSVRLGVMFENIDETVAADNDLSVTEGALIKEVLEESAAEAGLQVGDVVTAVNGDVIDAERTLRDRLIAYEAGDTITLDVLRADETLIVDVTLAAVEMGADMMPFFEGMPFDFGEGGFPRFFFGPDGGGFRSDPAEPAPNV